MENTKPQPQKEGECNMARCPRCGDDDNDGPVCTCRYESPIKVNEPLMSNHPTSGSGNEEIARKLCCEDHDDDFHMKDEIKKLLDAKDAERERAVARETERCCKDICSWCDEGAIPATYRKFKGLEAWVHRNETLGINNPCSAQAIRFRNRGEGS